ncbi:MAG TPA: type 1 glutamine amidotransferase domain-containing protein [Armatimonadota bacterium]|jgi:protease I
MADYTGKRVAVLVTSGVEEVELTRPVGFLCALGATVTVITPSPDEYYNVIHSTTGIYPGTSLYADALLSEVKPDDFDALYIPGGTSPDHLRLYPEAVAFVKAFRDKPIFALCHGPQMLVSAELVSGRTITSWPSLEVDIKNAGATWVDRDVVVDGNLVTSRKPVDIPNFNIQIAKVLEHPEQFRRKAA